MDIHEKYEHYNYALECRRRFSNRNSEELGYNKMKIQCPICNITTTINGCTAHSKLHPLIFQLKRRKIENFIFQRLKLEECVVCGKKILCVDLRGRVNHTKIATCSQICIHKVHSWIKRYLKYLTNCVVCGILMISENVTCSEACYRKWHSKNMILWHRDMKLNRPELYLERNRKIRLSSIITRKRDNYPPWNKGITGSLYLSYYDKPDGTNSLLEGIKKNTKWFRKTTPLIILLKMLELLDILHRHSIFVNNRQFDFLLKIGLKRLVVEVDGDWWHKSIRRCSDIELRKMTRLKDKLKEENIKKYRKGWKIVRVWLIDLYDDLLTVKTMFNNLKEEKIYE